MKVKVLSIIATGILVSGTFITSVQAMGRGDGPEFNTLVMKTMDANTDGKITKDEFMKMSARMASKKFMMMDVDDDGVLSQEEFMSVNR